MSLKGEGGKKKKREIKKYCIKQPKKPNSFEKKKLTTTKLISPVRKGWARTCFMSGLRVGSFTSSWEIRFLGTYEKWNVRIILASI